MVELIQIECDTVEETVATVEYCGHQRWVKEFYVPGVHALILAEAVGAVNQRPALACLAQPRMGFLWEGLVQDEKISAQKKFTQEILPRGRSTVETQ
jgi:hypothetical protein